jgi:cobalt/nickel transport system permease protein
MHAPDGFLTAGTAVATGAISATTIGIVLRTGQKNLSERQIPLAGASAAFLFAAQMVNFPVAAGTTGHLLGGALAAVLLGPSLGTLVLTTIVVVQALLFADGGITALGYNVLNMAIVTSLGGYGAYRLALAVLPRSRTSHAAAAGVAGTVSVLASAVAFSLEWLFGASAPVPFDTVFASVVGIHIPIALAEGAITAAVVGSILASRPDLVPRAAADGSAGADGDAGRPTKPVAPVVAVGLVLALALAAVVSQFAASDPDGLERAALDSGIEAGAAWYDDLPFADYAVSGIANPTLSLAVAGGAGVLVAVIVGLGLTAALRSKAGSGPSPTRRLVSTR